MKKNLLSLLAAGLTITNIPHINAGNSSSTTLVVGAAAGTWVVGTHAMEAVRRQAKRKIQQQNQQPQTSTNNQSTILIPHSTKTSRSCSIRPPEQNESFEDYLTAMLAQFHSNAETQNQVNSRNNEELQNQVNTRTKELEQDIENEADRKIKKQMELLRLRDTAITNATYFEDEAHQYSAKCNLHEGKATFIVYKLTQEEGSDITNMESVQTYAFREPKDNEPYSEYLTDMNTTLLECFKQYLNSVNQQ